jgi:hypothetical protein
MSKERPRAARPESRLPVQHSTDPEAIRRALSRDNRGNATGPLGTALHIIAGERGR